MSASWDPSTPPIVTKFKIGLCQLTVNPEKNHNLVHARRLINDAAALGAQLVVLPEMWNFPYSTDYFRMYAEDFSDKATAPSFVMLSELASRHGITIIGGSIAERDDGRLYNTCCVFGPDGELKAKHRKIHLFDFDGAKFGDSSFKESDTFTAGEEPTIVETDVGLIGIGICHDIRFPELASLYRQKGAHMICYPGAFNMSTGELLWELVQRGRAADNQLYVVTCSPSRNSAGSYTVWGHSSIVGPLGEIIATSGHEETVVVAEIDYARIEHCRGSLPLWKQRREVIYNS